MKKIRAGILGYGNLGKAVESLLNQNQKFELVCIFSHRDLKHINSKIEKIENLKKYNNKIDVLFLCGGSSSTLMKEAQESLNYFNTIDAFDTHKLIKKHIKICQKVAKNNKKVSFCSFGWDPGLFSLMRVLFSSLDNNVYTIWGKGISQGHSEAVRKIKNVQDALQYTIPNLKIVKKLKRGKCQNINNLHTRKCLVVADKKYQKEIKKQIKNMPNYFKGYKTIVKFVKKDVILKNKTLYHAGQVFTLGNNFNFSLKTKSNPNLTAKIMIMYSQLIPKYINNKMYGAYSILDIPFKEINPKANDLI